ncbi:MAG: hypothetical protein AB8B84_04070 [Granulosicoccus sp.]
MIKIVFLDRAAMGPDVDLTRPRFEHEWVEYDRTSPAQVATRVVGADIVITNKAPIRASTIAAQPQLKMISVTATGYDVVDVEAYVNGIHLNTVI